MVTWLPPLASSTETAADGRGEALFARTSRKKDDLASPLRSPHPSFIKMCRARGRAATEAYQGGIYLLTVQVSSHQMGLLLSPLTGWRAEVTDDSIAYLTNHKQDLKEGGSLLTAHLWGI